MSLNWKVDKIANYKEKCYRSHPSGTGVRLNPVTEILIWYCLGIDLTGITEKNSREFLIRIKMHDAVVGVLGQGDDGEDYHVTLQDVLDHVGLSTNVFPEATEAQFIKKLGKHLRSQAAREVDAQVKAREPKTARDVATSTIHG
jgi:hypothetical protein